ncbi:DUF4335 domain-containing protein [Chroogloeocystis siderophila]|jgi:hypothetical protein|uniref:DUF4335 domain-containing protein n=1 Tax=Chroogloeocystis siderophila 5.2 s.c.1 TaxID=247279 RepID=A0A1U7HXP3_9CHRO|nr:DUF4335 domain-containing protein [Chroogloeocystis siderophila]OKH28401.1 hypothetical protein NIES1031_03950 [Chroogloeocystis siderophila 5.2 s.c.1]
MALSNSQVLRRYTPPTCTLEIVAPQSPLSRWAGRTVATQLRFHLHFDDPRSPDQRVQITGDREQLEALQQAVSVYVQELLSQSPAQFTAQLASQTTAAESTTSVANSQIVISPTNSSDSPFARAQQIFLKPGTGLSHTLFLGPLATPTTGPVVQLSVLQLFDLATALDEFEADIVALPSLNQRRVSTTPPAWATIAAGLTLAVGIFAVLQQLNRPVQQTATSNQITEDPQQLAAQPSPLPPLSSLDTLPPPPPAGSPVPVPNAPLPAIPVPNASPSTESTAAAPSSTLPGGTTPAPQTTVISPGSPNKTGTAAAGNSAPTIAIPSPLAQLNAPNPGSQAAISQTQRTAPAPQRQAANNTTAAVRSPNQPPPAPSQPTSLDNISQVAEARQFFQRRWEPTEAVKQTLEYSLLLDVDGTIQRIEPLNQAARDQIDRTGMPLIGEPFVSPIADGQVARIRVVLTPDGKVQTFLEDREAPQVSRDPREAAE